MKRRNKREYVPKNGVIPHIERGEAPSVDVSKRLLVAAGRGLNVETASAFASVPHELVMNWLERGKKEEKEPFDVNKFDKDVAAHHLKYHRDVTVPCLSLWMKWKQVRSEMVLKSVAKINKSKDWRAQAWLLERIDPATFVRPLAAAPVKRLPMMIEKEVEASVVETKQVQFYFPDNGRGPTP